MTDYANDPAVSNLREYLRIRTVHPNINYDECIAYLRRQASELGLPVQVYEVVPKKPVLVMTWEGLEPSLSSVLLNSHMDVVPVFEESWTYPPFEARIVDGVIYARGVQDMKTTAVQYIEAVRRLRSKGIRLKRTLHICFVPDEELGGGNGMSVFVKSEHYRSLNVGFALDEGLSSPDDSFVVCYATRTTWPSSESSTTALTFGFGMTFLTRRTSKKLDDLKVTCPGKSGHGSLLLPDNCGEKIRYIIDKFMDLRKESKAKLESDPELTIGDVTSVNLTMLNGGIQNNIIPEKFTATFDLRLALSVNLEEFENMIKQWCSEAGDGVTYEFAYKEDYIPPTRLDDSNPYWLAFKAVIDKLKVPIKARLSIGGTDSRYIRQQGVSALGFIAHRNTRPRLHEHNESLHASVFLDGITIYEDIIPALANV